MLIETKLRPPVLKSNLIERIALRCQLDQAFDTKLAIVSASAGFGKSTLLGQWVRANQEKGVATGWLSIDACDNEISRFLEYMVAAINRAEASVGTDLLALIRSSPVLPVDTILTAIINDLSRFNSDLFLVLDDCHHLTVPEIGQLLDTLLMYAPSCFHLVIATRAQVPLKIANMRVKGQMIRIDDMSLRFSLADTEKFLNGARALDLEIADIVSLQHRTEGWIAGLQLASLSLGDRIDRSLFVQRFSGNDRDIADFLAHDVLDRLPETTIDFLLKSSILERISAPLAEFVTGRKGAEQQLADIENSNLFLIPLDRDRIWYRYHILFGDFLRSMLKKRQPENIERLHLAAAHWLSDNGFASEAVQHALIAGDKEFAAALVEKYCMPLFRQGHITQVREWLNSLPNDLVNQRPRLQLVKVWIMFHISQPLQAASILKAVKAQIQKSEKLGQLSLSDMRELRAELYTLTAGVISAADRSSTAARLAKGWLAQFPEGQYFSKGTLGNVLGYSLYSLGDLDGARLACISARGNHEAAQSVLGVVYSDLILGLVDLSAGNLSKAHHCFARATEHARKELGAGSYAEAMVGIFEVELLYERNDLAGAEQLLEQHRQIIEECGLVVHEMTCKLYVAKLAASKGNLDESLAVLERAEQQGMRTRYRRLFASALHERVRLLLQRGDVQTARLALKFRGIDESWIVSTDSHRLACEPEHLAVARLLIAEQRPEAATKILVGLAERVGRDGRMQRLSQVRALIAIAAYQAGVALSALAAIVDAVQLAAPQGMLRSLLDEGQQLQDVVAFARARIPSWNANRELGRFIETLMSGWTRTNIKENNPHYRKNSPKFSTREADVVRLLTRGQNNRDLAQALALAPDTVKWHLKNIFGKLGVSNRTQAVLKLQMLGFGVDGPNGSGIAAE